MKQRASKFLWCCEQGTVPLWRLCGHITCICANRSSQWHSTAQCLTAAIGFADEPFLAAVEDPNLLPPSTIVEHLVQSGIIESWLQLDTVTRYARSYIRDGARHQTRITPTNNLGRLFFVLYPDDIPHPEDNQFVKDAAREEETWEEDKQEERYADEQGETLTEEQPMDEDEGDDEVPPLESVTPSTSEGTRRTMTPEDERLDWGEEELPRPQQRQSDLTLDIKSTTKQVVHLSITFCLSGRV